jgi:glyoxylase-like metal-dependent hydrolase (beta-lactamase superfamily II)
MPTWTLTQLPVGPLQTNAYLLAAPEARQAVLVDPGGDAEVLLEALQQSECRLTHLLCTHGHFDHVAAAASIQSQHDLPLRCHPQDVAIILMMPDIQAGYGFPPAAVPKVAADLTDRQVLPFAGGQITVRHVPGHSPGHVMFSWNSDALVGDCIFAGSVGRTDLPGGSFSQLRRSIQECIYRLPAATRLHPGHGPSTTVGQERTFNPFVRALPE